MFKEIFIRLCNERGEHPTVVCQKIGVTSSAFSKWTDESVPRKATLMRIADYFGVSVDYLLGNVQMDLQHFAEKDHWYDFLLQISRKVLTNPPRCGIMKA